MANTISRRQALKLGGGALAGATALGAAGAGPASAATDWIRLPIITANIGRKRRQNREAAIRAVRHGDPNHRPFVGWQEIQEGDKGEPAMIKQYFGGAYQNVFLEQAASHRVPISVPRPWKVRKSKATFVHGFIGPDVSPPRWINEVVVEHEKQPGLEFVLINTHYLHGAYNGQQNPDLRDEWNLHKQKHHNRVMTHHNRGQVVIWTADTNNPGYDTATGLAAEHKAFPGGVDRIDWLPGDGTVQLDLVSTHIVPMDVDNHDARVAVFRIRLG
jgi:hypothetical protein